MGFLQNIKEYSQQYHRLMDNPELAKKSSMPGEAYFIKDNHILNLPREDGDNRYPFGEDGFNFWACTSGYMHSNEGLFSPYLRASEGQEPKIAFFAGLYDESGKHEVISLLSVPIIETDIEVIRYTVFTPSSVYYMTEANDLIFAIRVFVDVNKKMYFTTMVENNSGKASKVFISSYFNPFLKNAVMEGAENRWFRQGSVIPAQGDQNLDSFLIEVYEEKGRGLMVPNYGVFTRNIELSQDASIIKKEETTSRNNYVGGTRSSLHTPEALREGSIGNKSVTTFTEVAIAADLVSLKLGINGYVRLDTNMDCCFTDEDKDRIISKAPNSQEADEAEMAMLKAEKQQQSKLVAKLGKSNLPAIKEEVFESFFEHLKKQVEFCSLIKGYIQLSNFSLIGIRDVFQALEGLIYWQPEVAKTKMLEALDFVAPDGRCPRQYSLPTHEGESPNMDLRPFIDQGVWVISTISTYLRLTHDFKFLDEIAGYYDVVDDKAHLAVKSDKTSSVLQHMFDIMDFLLVNRDHEDTKCVLALYGDWNDALDGLGVTKKAGKEYGTGVSVMATLQVYQNCHEMIDLLETLDKDKYQAKIEEYKVAMDEIKQGLEKYAVVSNDKGEKRIVHGWGDDRSYFVGSYNDPDDKARDGITSNAFWTLSGMYDGTDKEIKNTILSAYDRLDSKYGLKTFEPAFDKGTPGIGRIPNLPAGTAENGAAYIHASAFAIMSLFQIGESKKAWDQLTKILPFTHEKVSVSPYVMPNSYGLNAEKQIDGESMQDWQTGSSNVAFKSIVRFVFGIEPTYEGVFIAPAKDMPFESMNIEIEVQGTKLLLEYEKQDLDKRNFTVEGIRQETIYDPIMGTDKIWLSNEFLQSTDIVHIRMID